MADFTAPIMTLAWLVKLELPEATLRLTDGGQAIWGADTFRSEDDEFGTLGEAETPEEVIGDEAPAVTVTILPRSAAAAATLSTPEYQGAPFKVWLARIDRTTGEVDGAPELAADMELDTTRLVAARGTRRLEMGLVSAAERLFSINEGAVLSTRFHQSVWPGEQGFDNATGAPYSKAWGVAGPPRGSSGGGNGAVLGGGGVNGALYGIINTAVAAR